MGGVVERSVGALFPPINEEEEIEGEEVDDERVKNEERRET